MAGSTRPRFNAKLGVRNALVGSTAHLQSACRRHAFTANSSPQPRHLGTIYQRRARHGCCMWGSIPYDGEASKVTSSHYPYVRDQDPARIKPSQATLISNIDLQALDNSWVLGFLIFPTEILHSRKVRDRPHGQTRVLSARLRVACHHALIPFPSAGKMDSGVESRGRSLGHHFTNPLHHGARPAYPSLLSTSPVQCST